MRESGVMEWNLEQLTGALRISETAVDEYFKDGRRISFVLERRLCAEHFGGKLAVSEGAGYDLLDRDGNCWEVRSLTRGGVYFTPSAMVGSGRRFEERGFREKLGSIAGFVVTDITLFPKVPFWKITSAQVRRWFDAGELGANAKLSYKKARELIGQL